MVLSFSFRAAFFPALLAKGSEEVELAAADNLGQDVAHWVMSRNPVPTGVAIYAVHPNEPLDSHYANLVENAILSGLVHQGISKVTACPQCHTAHVEVKDEQVFVTRSAVDMESIKAAAKNLPVESFLMVELYRTTFAIVAEATLYQNDTGEILGTEHFRVSAMNFNDSSVQVLLTVGFGAPLESTGTSSDIATSAGISLLEELGFAKGGLNLGALFAGSDTLLYLNPTLAFRGRIGSYGLAWSLNLGAGYGMLGSYRGITTRGSFELYLGSLAVVGVEGNFYFPQDATGQYLNGFIGFHIGLAFGR